MTGLRFCHHCRGFRTAKMFKVNEVRYKIVPDHPALCSLMNPVSAKVTGQMMTCCDYFFGHFFTSKTFLSLNSSCLPLFQFVTGRKYPQTRLNTSQIAPHLLMMVLLDFCVCFNECLPGKRKLRWQTMTVFCKACSTSHRSDEAFSAISADGSGNRAFPAESGAFLCNPELLVCKQNDIDPFREQTCCILMKTRCVAVV